MAMSPEQIREARRELARFKSEFQSVAKYTERAGRDSARKFGRNFKTVAKSALAEFGRGVMHGLGEKWVASWGKKGSASGKNFSKRFKRSAQQSLKAQGGGTGLLKRGLGSLNLSTLGVVGGAALAATVVAQFRSGLDAAMEQERLVISLDSLSADGAGGGRIFQSLRRDALRTGTDVADMAGNVRKMMAQGMGEAEALKLSKAMLDIAGATGLTSSELALLGNALSQVKGKGQAAMEELRGQIAEKGVPIFEALRQRFNAENVGEVFDMIKKGQVTADDVIQTFSNLEGPFARFAGAADRMGKTGLGLFGRLRQHLVDLKREFAAEVLPELKPVLEDAIGLVGRLKDQAKEFGQRIGDALGFLRAMTQELSLGEMLKLAGLQLKQQILSAMDAGWRGANAIHQLFIGDEFGDAMERAALRFKKTMLEGVAEVLDALGSEQKKDHPLAFLIKPGGILKKGAEALGMNPTDFLNRRAEQIRERIDGLGSGSAGNPANLMERFLAEMEKQPGRFELSMGDQKEMERLIQKIRNRQAQNGSDESAPTPPPSAGGGAAGAAASRGPFDPTAVLGSGLAGAINKIAGGASVVIMDKQLQVQKKTQQAADRTAKAVETLVKNSNPRRNRNTLSSAKLVL